MNSEFFILLTLFILSLCFRCFSLRMVPVKVLDETINYDPGNSEFGDGNIPDIRSSIKPANFSGPGHFQALVGKCFSWVDSKYKYNFCPFHNITQSELQESWNSYKGTLGIWGEWVVQGNHFAAMRMVQGDTCGDKERSTVLHIECGRQEGLKDVMEPGAHCVYEGTFYTPLACHEHSLLVYPRLPTPELRLRWDNLETGLFNGDISEKDYSAGLQAIFRDAGYLLPISNGQTLSLRADRAALNNPVNTQGSQMSCQAELNLLKRQLEEVKKELMQIKSEKNTVD
ncbi:N-acetylglucosamine-1-phosphotransferase subunit gamma-like isoform X2 [Ischnura elegans]|uniref:N-acetylglucosamine-1-phosphotransferase subunit gamma-like isoform X2 n=1 Tax=Ischnura elegans TaxID=197161 RepID=UPI001ED87988|nr:N-acetylglucosamine-1-phosphotransferase subunit gamma-like isoform X2 [Ischnura elegans]